MKRVDIRRIIRPRQITRLVKYDMHESKSYFSKLGIRSGKKNCNRATNHLLYFFLHHFFVNIRVLRVVLPRHTQCRPLRLTSYVLCAFLGRHGS